MLLLRGDFSLRFMWAFVVVVVVAALRFASVHSVSKSWGLPWFGQYFDGFRRCCCEQQSSFGRFYGLGYRQEAGTRITRKEAFE